MSPAPTRTHQRVVSLLAARLIVHIEAHELGECHVAPFDVVLDAHTVVQPDILFVAAERVAALDDGHGFTGAPDLVVEVLSPSTATRDRTDKREAYRRAGVRWLLLVDPSARTVEVFRLHEGRWLLDQAVGGAETLELELFAGLELELAELWPGDAS